MVGSQIGEGFRHHLHGLREFVCACDDFLIAHGRTPEIRVCGRREQSKDTVLESDAIFGTSHVQVGSLLRVAFCPRPGFQKRLGPNMPTGRIRENFAEFFAELRAERAPNRPFGSTLLR
jgi:hypothetical protein